jgi:hypothetical protein
MSNPGLGKISGVYRVSPAFLQRAAAVSVLSFVFFVLMMFGFYVRQNIGYFLLATAFLAVNVLTLVGWLAIRRGTVRIYGGGIEFRRFRARWDEIERVELRDDGKPAGGRRHSATIVKRNGESAEIPDAIAGAAEIAAVIRSKIDGPISVPIGEAGADGPKP